MNTVYFALITIKSKRRPPSSLSNQNSVILLSMLGINGVDKSQVSCLTLNFGILLLSEYPTLSFTQMSKQIVMSTADQFTVTFRSDPAIPPKTF